LVGVAHGRGHDATYLGLLGLDGTPDGLLLPVILGGGYSFVTNNRRDFRRLFGAVDGHAGLVIIIPSRKREGQAELFNLALDKIEGAGSNVADLLIEVHGDGRVTIERYPQDGSAK
jgi:hypothetical protein